jgi:hypothetical protein
MAAHAVDSLTDADVLGADVLKIVVKALAQSGEPLNAEAIWKQIPKSLRPRKKAAFFELLERKAGDGSLWKLAPFRGKAERYSHQPLEQYAKQVVLAEMGDKPITENTLKKKISKRLGSPTDHELQAMLDRLVADGSLSRIEIRKKAQYFSRRTNLNVFFASAFKAFKKKVDELADKIAESGIPRDAALRSVGEMLGDWLQPAELSPAPNGATPRVPAAGAEQLPFIAPRDDGSVDDRILDAIAELCAATRSPLVSAARLRRSLELHFADKAAFDRAVLNLSRQGKIALHHHDYPYSLSADEREALVTDGQKFFSEIALRQ